MDSTNTTLNPKSSTEASATWRPTNQSLLFSLQDPHDLRWGDLTQLQAPTQNHSSSIQNAQDIHKPLGLWGYSDDLGISLNGGRIGAALAPDFIRKYFYRLTPPSYNFADSNLTQSNKAAHSIDSKSQLIDYGNWLSRNNLQETIHALTPLLTDKLKTHSAFITLGGGHDYGAVDGAAFLNYSLSSTSKLNSKNNSLKTSLKPMVLNFDAHLDVRPWKSGLNSGTPFSWLLDHYPDQFEFIEVGIQKQCSSPHHHNWLKEKGATIVTRDYIHQVGLLNALKQILAGTSTNQKCFVSFDMDVFSQDIAPGCSQSWSVGLSYGEVQSALNWLYSNKSVSLLGIYEVSPPLDVDHRTSKLAACLMDDFYRSHKSK